MVTARVILALVAIVYAIIGRRLFLSTSPQKFGSFPQALYTVRYFSSSSSDFQFESPHSLSFPPLRPVPSSSLSACTFVLPVRHSKASI